LEPGHIAYTLIETAKRNGIDPQAWLTDFPARIADHKITRIDVLLPWRHATTLAQLANRPPIVRKRPNARGSGAGCYDGLAVPRAAGPGGGGLGPVRRVRRLPARAGLAGDGRADE